MKDLIERIKTEIDDAKEVGDPPNERSYGMEWGVLLSLNEAQKIVDALSASITPVQSDGESVAVPGKGVFYIDCQDSTNIILKRRA